jgi:ribosome biogenesis protein ERB1
VKKAEAAAKRKQAEQAAADGVFEGSSGCHPSAGKGGYLSLQPLHGFPVRNISWHRKGDYISLVSPRANTSAVFIAHLSRRMVQKPFSKAKDQITGAQFHPAKPFFFVSSKRHIRVYNLAKQTLARKLQPGVQWISSFDCHPGGDNLLLGSFDRRVCWFDLDLSNRPYKTLKLGQQAVRSVAYSPKYPMFAAGNDHGQVQIFHGRVYSDLMQNALIVPLKKLKGHKVVDGVGKRFCVHFFAVASGRFSQTIFPLPLSGVMDVKWHPTQPWVITAGADKVIHLFS